ncbi:MAG: hypothetical protein AAFU38_06990 [Bacteroidota bacterium]
MGFAEHPQTVAEHIKRRRFELGISQLQLAQRLDACVYTVITWECHDNNPSFAFWPGLIDFLGYDPYGEPRTLGECLSWLRRRNGVELPACAEMIGVGTSTLRFWERGGKPTNARTRYLLRTYLAYERARLKLPASFGIDPDRPI